MNSSEFMQKLQAKTRPEVAREIPSEILFSVGSLTLRFDPQANQFTTEEKSESHLLPELHSHSWQRLYDVLVGEYSVMDAFFDRSFWMNGYLPMLFQLQALFQPTLSTQLPE